MKEARPKPTQEEINAAVAAWVESLKSHDEHEKRQVGPCVYCVPCELRLYQGRLDQ